MHLRLFTDHQYFDSPGLFISVVMSLPFLLICCFIVVSEGTGYSGVIIST